MIRHNATAEDIAKLNEDRKSRASTRAADPPMRDGLTKEQTREALRSLPKSGQTIPKKLVPKRPQ